MNRYRLFGAETSPYSVKVRSFLRYKKIDFEWITRSAASDPEFAHHTQSASVPLLISPDNAASQDSSAILVRLEADHPEPAGQPTDDALAGLSLLLEDYADEWVNKAMFHYRWTNSPDRENAAERVLDQLLGGRKAKDRAAALHQVMDSMTGRLPLVGVGGSNGKVIEASFRRLVHLLNEHLKAHLCLLGGHPSFADFALAAQLNQMLADPTPGTMIRDEAPFVAAWCEFMEAPSAGAPYASLEDLSPTLLPLLREELAVAYLPWAAANAEGTSRRRKLTKVELAEGDFEQSTQRYAGLSFKAIRKDLARAAPKKALDPVFDAAGAKPFI